MNDDGFHVAAANLRHVMPLIRKRMGFAETLVEGTLNVRIPAAYIVQPDATIAPHEYGINNETIKLQRCRIAGHRGIIMRPDSHEVNHNYGHGPAHLEIMGAVRFREVLQLEDGSPIDIEIEGDEDWWISN